MSLLVIYKILGLLVNTFATDDKYTLLNSDNLMQQIQMLITKKETNFLNCFSVLLKSRSSFEDFGKKMTLRAYIFPKLLAAKDGLR